MPKGYFFVHFISEEDYAYALYEGPWMISDYYLIVPRWCPMFFQNVDQVKKVTAWVRMPRLPLELYNAQFLGRISAGLGTILKIDRLTLIH